MTDAVPAPSAARAPAPAPRRRLRRVAVGVLLVVVFVLTPLTAAALYTRAQVLDTDHYLDTVRPLASDPAVQDYVADRVTVELFARLGVERVLRDLLPGRTELLAPAARGAAEGYVRDALKRALDTEAFERVWVEANRVAHAQLRHLLTGEGEAALSGRADDGAISIDLAATARLLSRRLAANGIDVSPRLLGVSGRITIYRFDDLYRARRAVRLLNRSAFALPVLLVVCAAGAVVVAVDRRRAGLGVGIAVVAGAGLLAAALAFGRDRYLDGATTVGMPLDAAGALYDALLRPLVTSVRIALLVGLALIVVALVLGVVQRTIARRSRSRDDGGPGPQPAQQTS